MVQGYLLIILYGQNRLKTVLPTGCFSSGRTDFKKAKLDNRRVAGYLKPVFETVRFCGRVEPVVFRSVVVPCLSYFDDIILDVSSVSRRMKLFTFLFVLNSTKHKFFYFQIPGIIKNFPNNPFRIYHDRSCSPGRFWPLQG